MVRSFRRFFALLFCISLLLGAALADDGYTSVSPAEDGFLVSGGSGAVYIDADGNRTVCAASAEPSAEPADDAADYGLSAPLVGVASTEYITAAAASDGTIAVSYQGGAFELFDYNRTYGDNVTLTSIVSTGSVIYIAGTDEDGSAFMAGSVLGKVWSPRLLYMLDDTDNSSIPLQGTPLCMTYIESWRAVLVGCTGGTAAVIPTCEKCNAFYTVTEDDITAAAVNEQSGTVCFLAGGNVILRDLNDLEANENPDHDCENGCRR